MTNGRATPIISVVILNYNGARWLDKCVSSLREQTIFDQIEVILADNLSTDGSDRLAEELMAGWMNGLFVQNGSNLGFCEGNNRAARQATGKYLFFLNNDAWLEPACLEILLQGTEQADAVVSTPLVMNYDTDEFQSLGAAGFDLFGFATARLEHTGTRKVLMPEGCSYLIRRELFIKIGGFDAEFFMFADELDLSWRVWISGYKAVAVPAARLHHRGAANVNPKGEGSVVEFRTSDTKRFFANRNSLLVLLKNAQHLLLLLVPLQLLLLAAEALVGSILLKRLSFFKKTFLAAVEDCIRLQPHIKEERRRIATFRQRSDWAMLRFFNWRLNRWEEIRRTLKHGVPKVGEK